MSSAYAAWVGRLWVGQVLAVLTLTIAGLTAAAAQQTTLSLDPARTSVNFTLGAALHTVHGTFRAKPGALQINSAAGLVSGEIDIDAKSGETGSGMRDRKMHKDVLQSEQYPDISFRPDRFEGVLATQGKSSVKVHGMFRVHGVDREIMVPADVEMAADHWSATVHFTVPYVKWGMQNPSTLFLRVSDAVDIELVAGGSVQHSAANSGSPNPGPANSGSAQ
ncbi:MAG TPA: YceI family protein [Candidatus Sulfotelmatobacter sp.]|nr:YceI family protein [Candidatus Sulfotelmatobacter sp.]